MSLKRLLKDKQPLKRGGIVLDIPFSGISRTKQYQKTAEMSLIRLLKDKTPLKPTENVFEIPNSGKVSGEKFFGGNHLIPRT
jgi:hypothetical protein